MYPSAHAVALGKSETFSVEADNAEPRHYLDYVTFWRGWPAKSAAPAGVWALGRACVGTRACRRLVRVCLEQAAAVPQG